MIVGYTLSDPATTTRFSIFEIEYHSDFGPLVSKKIIGSTIKSMSTVCSLNALGGQPLINGSASTILLKTYDLILDIFLLSQHIHNHNVFDINT
jgi:hypothetical protein